MGSGIGYAEISICCGAVTAMGLIGAHLARSRYSHCNPTLLATGRSVP